MANPPDGTDPVTFKTPTLGRAVRLGELYDQRSGQFLGVQLYSEDSIQVAETDIKHTELSLSLSTTLEDKAYLLDIYARLTLEILCGLVSVTGSASYVKDTKSNTKEQAFALALKMRLNEKRILFTENALGRNVLRVTSEDYILNGSATHFVSAIVYGGTCIVNLVARQSKLETNEMIEGQLTAKFDKLKALASIEGGARVKITDEFKSMDDKFDIVVHGEVALDRVPINLKDLLEIVPECASLIKEDGGVPISVTLQPIPKKLMDARKVYELDARFVDDVMKAFSELDDIRSRFSVLLDGTKSVEQFVPELSRVARAVTDRYTEEHGLLLLDLRKFLVDYQHGIPPGEDWQSEDPDETKNIPVLKKVRDLHNRHLLPDDDSYKPSQYYPSTLVGLENELRKFHYFTSDIQQARDSAMSLPASSKDFVYLSDLDAICRAIRLQNEIPLFVMTPFTTKQPTPVTLTPDLSVIQFLAILRHNAQYFDDSSNPARILYAETAEGLSHRLPNLIEASGGLKNPSLLIGQVDKDGGLSWSEPPPETKFCLKINHMSLAGKSGDLWQYIEGLDGRLSFSLQVAARAGTNSADNSVICALRTLSEAPWLTFQMKPFGFVIQQRQLNPIQITIGDKELERGQLFVATLVQNVEDKITIFYLESMKVKDANFSEASDLLDESKDVEIAYPAADPAPQKDITWWNGTVLEVKTFSYALTPEQVQVEVEKTWKEHEK